MIIKSLISNCDLSKKVNQEFSCDIDDSEEHQDDIKFFLTKNSKMDL